jgi:hypothetical protein
MRQVRRPPDCSVGEEMHLGRIEKGFELHEAAIRAG